VAKTAKANLPPNLPPRGLNGRQAAEYFGCSLGTFEKLVRLGLAPPPIDLPGCERNIYDRLALDISMTARAVAAGCRVTAAEPERVSG
jgi:hypothetical protein